MKHRNSIGNPKYKIGDTVSFELKLLNGENKKFIGTVQIVDAYGTFEQNEEASYDVMVEHFGDGDAPCLVKHLRESMIKKE